MHPRKQNHLGASFAFCLRRIESHFDVTPILLILLRLQLRLRRVHRKCKLGFRDTVTHPLYIRDIANTRATTEHSLTLLVAIINDSWFLWWYFYCVFGFIVETLSLSCPENFEINFKHWMRISQRQVSVGISLAVGARGKGGLLCWEGLGDPRM